MRYISYYVYGCKQNPYRSVKTPPEIAFQFDVGSGESEGFLLQRGGIVSMRAAPVGFKGIPRRDQQKISKNRMLVEGDDS